MTIAALLAAAVAAALAATVMALLILQRRQQRQVSALLERLDELEARWVDAGVAVSQSAGTVNQPAEVSPSDQRSFSASGDALAGLTSHVQRIVQGGGRGAHSLADQAIACVHRRMRENVAPSQIAADLYVSLRTLERGLAATLDCSPSQLILAMKMREAKRLLASGQWRVSEVAEHLAFANAFHFSRRFKSFYRVAPSELRQRSS